MALVKAPTMEALGKHPFAVVTVTASAKDPTQSEKDFEWFDRQTQVDQYFIEIIDLMRDEVEEGQDVYILIASITDTKNMTVGEIKVVHPETKEATAYCEQWVEDVSNDPNLLVAQVEVATYKTRKASTKGAKPVKKVQRTIKGRKPSAAAASALKPTAPAKSSAPKPRPANPKVTPSSVKAKIAAKTADKAEPVPVNALVRPTSPRRRKTA